MHMLGPNSVRRTVQTNPALLCYALGIKEQKQYWQLLAQKFDQFQAMHSN